MPKSCASLRNPVIVCLGKPPIAIGQRKEAPDGTVRRIRRFVQKMAKDTLMNDEETQLAMNCVLGISKTGSCKVSDIARTLPGKQPLREAVRPFYDGLADPCLNAESDFEIT